MSINTYPDLDVTPANNIDLLGSNATGTADANTIDTLFQKFAAMTARFYGDIGGLGSVGGSANAITLTSLSSYQALETGLIVGFKAGAANTGATTLNLDALGAKPVRRKGDVVLVANEIVASGRYLLVYDETYAGTGAWVILNPEGYAAGGNDVAVADGGTGLSSYTIGDILYASAAAILSKLGIGAVGKTLRVNSAATAPEWADAITLGSPTTPSGTAVNFTSIPDGVNRVTVTWAGLSTNGTSPIMVQIGDSGGIETSGYSGAVVDGSDGSRASFSSGFAVTDAQAATSVLHGLMTMTLLDRSTNTWAMSGTMGPSSSDLGTYFGGSKSLSATLDRVRITTIGGTDTFDAGKVNVAWER